MGTGGVEADYSSYYPESPKAQPAYVPLSSHRYVQPVDDILEMNSDVVLPCVDHMARQGNLSSPPPVPFQVLKLYFDA